MSNKQIIATYNVKTKYFNNFIYFFNGLVNDFRFFQKQVTICKNLIQDQSLNLRVYARYTLSLDKKKQQNDGYTHDIPVKNTPIKHCLDYVHFTV